MRLIKITVAKKIVCGKKIETKQCKKKECIFWGKLWAQYLWNNCVHLERGSWHGQCLKSNYGHPLRSNYGHLERGNWQSSIWKAIMAWQLAGVEVEKQLWPFWTWQLAGTVFEKQLWPSWTWQRHGHLKSNYGHLECGSWQGQHMRSNYGDFERGNWQG